MLSRDSFENFLFLILFVSFETIFSNQSLCWVSILLASAKILECTIFDLRSYKVGAVYKLEILKEI